MVEIATNFHDQWVILLCLRLCPTLRDEFVTQAYVRAARDGRGIPEPFKRGPTARVPPGEWVIYLPDRHVCPRDIVAGADARPGSAALTMRPWWPDTGVMTAETPPAVAPESPLMSLPGAVVADGVDAGVAAHYGNPLGEQRRLAEDVAFVDRSSRGVIRVPGTDRLSWLHSLTTQHLSALPAGRGTEALVLSPHGHVEHHLIVADDGEITWLDVEPGTAPGLLTFLDAMRFLLRVDPRDATADWAVLTVGGPATDSVLRAALEVMVGSTPYDVTPLPGGGLVRRRPWPGAQAVDLVVPRDQLEAVAARLAAAGAEPAGIDAFEALRVAGRWPRLAFETDHRTIPHEVGWLETAVHLNKGCYRGQETVARVHNLGKPPRRLVLLHLDGSGMALPRTGDPVATAARSVGVVTTAVRHYELGSIALALVKRNTADEAIASAGPCAAVVEPLPDA